MIRRIDGPCFAYLQRVVAPLVVHDPVELFKSWLPVLFGKSNPMRADQGNSVKIGRAKLRVPVSLCSNLPAVLVRNHLPKREHAYHKWIVGARVEGVRLRLHGVDQILVRGSKSDAPRLSYRYPCSAENRASGSVLTPHVEPLRHPTTWALLATDMKPIRVGVFRDRIQQGGEPYADTQNRLPDS